MKSECSSRRLGWLTTAILLPLLLLTLPRLETLQLNFFCAPAAHLAGFFIGAPVASIDGGYGIAAAKPIEVVLDCSAIRFFALSLAILSGLAVERRMTPGRMLLILPLSYLLTLVGNASRIVSTWYTDAAAAHVLPSSLLPGIHALVGALVFMSFLSFAYLILWRMHDESNDARTAA